MPTVKFIESDAELVKKSKNTKLHMVCHHLSVLFENSAKMHLKSKKSDIKENTKWIIQRKN